MLIVFWPLDGHGREIDSQPPFVEEMDVVPRVGEFVVFYKTELRHPVASLLRTDPHYGDRCSWKVTSVAMYVPDLKAAIVRVENCPNRNMTRTTLDRLAQALDIDVAPCNIADFENGIAVAEGDVPEVTYPFDVFSDRIEIDRQRWSISEDFLKHLQRDVQKAAAEMLQRGRDLLEIRENVVRMVQRRVKEGVRRGHVKRREQ